MAGNRSKKIEQNKKKKVNPEKSQCKRILIFDGILPPHETFPTTR